MTCARQRAHRYRRAGRSMCPPAPPKCWTDSSQRATLLWHRLHRHGVGRGTVLRLAGTSGRRRAHLLRHRARCTAPCHHCRRTAPTASAPPPPSSRLAPAKPPCRAAWLARIPITTWTVPQPQPGNNDQQAKPPPHRRIVSDPDQRSHRKVTKAHRDGCAFVLGSVGACWGWLQRRIGWDYCAGGVRLLGDPQTPRTRITPAEFGRQDSTNATTARHHRLESMTALRDKHLSRQHMT